MIIEVTFKVLKIVLRQRRKNIEDRWKIRRKKNKDQTDGYRNHKTIRKIGNSSKQ